MKPRIILSLLVLLLVGFHSAHAQEWGIHINLNELYPLANSQKGYYPALWYSSAEGRGVLLGGFGAGMSWEQPWKRKSHIRGQFLIGRTRYYDMPVVFTDESGALLGGVIGIATHMQASLLGMASYDLFSWMRIGSGVGLQSTLLGWTDYGEVILNGKKVSLHYRERTRRPLTLTLPFELSVSLGRHWQLRERLEWSITPVSRQAGQRKERYLINQVEVSYAFGPAGSR